MPKSTASILIVLAITLSSLVASAKSINNKGLININELVVSNSAAEYSIGIPATRDPAEDEVALTLNDLLDIALRYNRSIEVVRQKVAQSVGQLTQARSGYLPRLSVLGRYFYTERQDSAVSSGGGTADPVFDQVEEDDILHGAANLTQLIYDFGKTTGAIKVGKSNLTAEEANLARQLQDVVFQVKEAYYNVLEKMRLIDVAKQSVGSFEQHLERAKVYYKAGVRTKIDVINAEVELSGARLSLLRAEYNLKLARVGLEQVLGYKPNGGKYVLESDQVELDNVLDSMPPVPASLENSISEALEERSDIHQLKSIVEASEADIKSSRGNYWPALIADAKVNDYDTTLSLYKDYWEVGVGLRWELFSGFETKGEVAEATGRYRENMAKLQDLELVVVSEVTDSFLKTEENRESVEIALQTLALAKENVQLAEKRYESGAYDVIEFNDAQLSLTKTQSELVVAYYGYLTAFAGVEFAIGRSFMEDVDQLPAPVEEKEVNTPMETIQPNDDDRLAGL
ncbi:MAG: TolC family protein [Desulfobulbaceae bacterium]|nr:MAG: TolC family protein [Desulfobulbaceae bacterium]